MKLLTVRIQILSKRNDPAFLYIFWIAYLILDQIGYRLLFLAVTSLVIIREIVMRSTRATAILGGRYLLYVVLLMLVLPLSMFGLLLVNASSDVMMNSLYVLLRTEVIIAAAVVVASFKASLLHIVGVFATYYGYLITKDFDRSMSVFRYAGLFHDPNYAVILYVAATYFSIKLLKKEETLSSILSFLCISASTILTLLTVSRTGYIAYFSFLLIVLSGILWETKKRRSQVSQKNTVIALFVLLFLMFTPQFQALLGQGFQMAVRRLTNTSFVDTSGMVRIEQIILGIKIFFENPSFLLTGTGLGTSSYYRQWVEWDFYTTYGGTSLIHNTYVSILTESGIISLFLFAAILWLTIKKALRNRDAADVGVCISLFILASGISCIYSFPFWYVLIWIGIRNDSSEHPLHMGKSGTQKNCKPSKGKHC